jgi:hypothetical protein
VIATNSGFSLAVSQTVAVLLVVLVGCGKAASPAVPVKGKVVYKNRPAAEVLVTFHPKDSREKTPSPVFTDNQGAFALECPPGSYKVTVLAVPKAGNAGATASAGPVDARAAPARPAAAAALPPAVQDTVQTPLTVDVPAGGKDDVLLKLDP